MGLKDIADASTNSNDTERKYKSFGHHEWNSRLEEMVEDLQKRFPCEIDCEFIEVSPSMTKTGGKAYYREEGNYIRVSERVIETETPEYVKMIVAHEMVHLYCYQKGHHNVSDGDKLFNWLLGMVCADVSRYSPSMKVWQDLAEPMIEHQNRQ